MQSYQNELERMSEEINQLIPLQNEVHVLQAEVLYYIIFPREEYNLDHCLESRADRGEQTKKHLAR